MSSPDKISFFQFIQIDRKNNTPIYLQLVKQLINAIQSGYLIQGCKIPGSRILSENLGIHRKTVIKALDDLHGQGWIEVIPHKGTYILGQKGEKSSVLSKTSENILFSYPTKPSFSFHQSNLLDDFSEPSNCMFELNEGLPDIRLSPIKEIAGMYSSSLKNINRFRNNNDFFRTQLVNYLNNTRGLRISKENLFVCRNPETSIYILSKLLISKNDRVVVAELNNATVNMIFQQAGAVIQTISLDNEGILVDDLEKLLKSKPIRLLYVSTYHQYPTTVRLSASRRLQLIELSKKYSFIIIEDDYACDFQYEKNFIMPLVSADYQGSVLYVGNFGQWLVPFFSVGFIAAPKAIIDELYKYYTMLNPNRDVVMEQVLGELIAGGDIYRHWRKSLKIYQERRNQCVNLLNTYLSDYIDFDIPEGGLAFWIKFETTISLLKLARQCRKNNLFVPKGILYQNKKIAALRLGFGHLEQLEMQTSLTILKEEIEKLKINFKNKKKVVT